MSRTYKDKKWRLRFPESDWRFGTERVPTVRSLYNYSLEEDRVLDELFYNGFCFMELPGVKTKKRKKADTDYHWVSNTPSWWTRLFMNRPQRAAAHTWEKRVVHLPVDLLEEVDLPNVSKKPHKYYW